MKNILLIVTALILIGLNTLGAASLISVDSKTVELVLKR